MADVGEPAAPFTGADGTLCAQCAARGGTCCLAPLEHQHLAFPLSDKEWERIAPYDHLALLPLPGNEASPLGGAGEPFIPPSAHGTERGRVAEGNSPEFIESLRDLFPRVDAERITRIFPPEGAHFRLRTTPGGACVFLGAAGCRLPREARPWYCLLFPAWVKEKEIVLFLADFCLISRQAVSPAHGLRLLGLTREQVFSLYEHVRADWGLIVPRHP